MHELRLRGGRGGNENGLRGVSRRTNFPHEGVGLQKARLKMFR